MILSGIQKCEPTLGFPPKACGNDIGLKILKTAFFCAVVFLGMASGVFAAEEKKAEPGVPTEGKLTTVSRLVFDPKLSQAEMAGVRMSDGSDPINLRFEKNAYRSVQYSKTKLEDDVLAMNKKSSEFFAEENQKKRDFFKKIREDGAVTPEEAEELRVYQQEEMARREEFAVKQQVALDQFICEKGNKGKKDEDRLDCGQRKKIMLDKFKCEKENKVKLPQEYVDCSRPAQKAMTQLLCEEENRKRKSEDRVNCDVIV